MLASSYCYVDFVGVDEYCTWVAVDHLHGISLTSGQFQVKRHSHPLTYTRPSSLSYHLGMYSNVEDIYVDKHCQAREAWSTSLLLYAKYSNNHNIVLEYSKKCITFKGWAFALQYKNVHSKMHVNHVDVTAYPTTNRQWNLVGYVNHQLWWQHTCSSNIISLMNCNSLFTRYSSHRYSHSWGHYSLTQLPVKLPPSVSNVILYVPSFCSTLRLLLSVSLKT